MEDEQLSAYASESPFPHLIIDNFYKEKVNQNTFKENNLNKFFYYFGREATLDVLNFTK